MSFDHLAPFYSAAEWLTAGTLLQRARTEFIDELSGRTAVLSVGEGHGRFAAAYTREFTDATLTCLEQSVEMQRQAVKRLGTAAHRVKWLEGDLRSTALLGPYDAIVTCFSLDCFSKDQLDEVIDRLAAATTADAVWLIADFAIPAAPMIARYRALAAHALMYRFFRLTTSVSARALTSPGAALRRNGFERVHHRTFDAGLVHSDVWRRRSAPERPFHCHAPPRDL